MTAQLQTGLKLKHAKDCTEISFKGVEDSSVLLRNMCFEIPYKIVDTYLPLAVSLSVMQLVHHVLISPKRFPFFL